MTRPTLHRPGPILDYRGPTEPSDAEPWGVSVLVSILACGLVLGGVVFIVIRVLEYLLLPVQY